MPGQPVLNRDQQWEKLAHWLGECIASIQKGDLSRLPSQFTGEQADAAIAAYETVQQAMHILEHWDTMGLASAES